MLCQEVYSQLSTKTRMIHESEINRHAIHKQDLTNRWPSPESVLSRLPTRGCSGALLFERRGMLSSPYPDCSMRGHLRFDWERISILEGNW